MCVCRREGGWEEATPRQTPEGEEDHVSEQALTTSHRIQALQVRVQILLPLARNVGAGCSWKHHQVLSSFPAFNSIRARVDLERKASPLSCLHQCSGRASGSNEAIPKESQLWLKTARMARNPYQIYGRQTIPRTLPLGTLLFWHVQALVEQEM